MAVFGPQNGQFGQTCVTLIKPFKILYTHQRNIRGNSLLLRRITEHVKAQNWTAVALDFVIVVVGVFIGIQVANWNETQQEHKQATGFLGRLEADFIQQLERSDRSIAGHQQSLHATARLIDGITSGAFDEKAILTDIDLATDVMTPPGPSTAFQEFVSSGKTDLIRSDALRSTLYEYNAYVSFVRDEYGSFTAPITKARSTLMRARSIETSGIPSKEFNELSNTVAVDSTKLLTDREIFEVLQLAYQTQDNVHLVLVKIRERIEVILTLIETEQERAQ